MRISPTPATKVVAAFALILSLGALGALATGATGAAELLLLAILPTVLLMALCNCRDTRRQSGR